jgi:hypothetical protein
MAFQLASVIHGAPFGRVAEAGVRQNRLSSIIRMPRQMR